MFARLSRVFDFDMGTGLSHLAQDDVDFSANVEETPQHTSTKKANLVDQSCQTDTFMMDKWVVECSHDVETETVTTEAFDSMQKLSEKNKQIDAMQSEIGFLKAELGTKQSTIEHLLQLLKSNMDVTKEMSREKRRYGSDVTGSDDVTLVSESRHRPNSQIIHDWQLNAVMQHDLTLCNEDVDNDYDDDDEDEEEFQDSLNSNYIKPSLSMHSGFEILTDSLEVNDT